MNVDKSGQLKHFFVSWKTSTYKKSKKFIIKEHLILKQIHWQCIDNYLRAAIYDEIMACFQGSGDVIDENWGLVFKSDTSTE